jgi:putative NADH-flavin reductase
MTPSRPTIALFGATGRTGRRVLDLAVAQGYPVRALVRNPAKLSQQPGVTILTGNVLEPDDVDRTVAGSDAVISCLGNAGLKEPGVALSQGTRHIVAAMQKHGVRRVLNVAGGGVLLSPDGTMLRSEMPTFPEIFRLTSAQHRLAWEALRDSDLDWTTVATPDIPDAPATGTARVLRDYMPPGARTVSTGDIAEFLIRELTECYFVRTRVGMAY